MITSANRGDVQMLSHSVLALEILNAAARRDVRFSSEPPLCELSLSGPALSLRTLEGIELIGSMDEQSTRELQSIDVSDNQLTMLEPLSELFPRLVDIDASFNNVVYLGGRRPMEHRWRRPLSFLLALNLSHNRLVEAPQLSAMPQLRVLNLASNTIHATNLAKRLRCGLKLETIDLSNNNVDFGVDDYTREIRIAFRRLANLRTLRLQHNPFTYAIVDYDLHILATMVGHGRAKPFSTGYFINDIEIDEQFWKKATRWRKPAALAYINDGTYVL